MTKGHPLLAAVALSAFALLSAGCQPTSQTGSTAAQDHEHEHEGEHDHPETYSAAVHEIEHLKEEIRTAFEAGNGEEAHDALHEVGHLLDEIPALAEKAGLSADDVAAAKASADKAFQAFGKLDTFHGDQVEVAYDTVKDDIEAGIAELESHLPAGEEHSHDEEHEHTAAE